MAGLVRAYYSIVYTCIPTPTVFHWLDTFTYTPSLGILGVNGMDRMGLSRAVRRLQCIHSQATFLSFFGFSISSFFESDFNSADNSGRTWDPYNRVTHPVRDTGAVRSAQSCIGLLWGAGARTWEYVCAWVGTWDGIARGYHYSDGPYYSVSMTTRRAVLSVLVTICRMKDLFDIYAFMTDSALYFSVCVVFNFFLKVCVLYTKP